MINWTNTHKIFDDYERYVVHHKNKTLCRTSEEINDAISENYFDKILNDIDALKSVMYEYKFVPIVTHTGRDCAMVKTWIGFNSDKKRCKMEYWVTNNKGWAIIFTNTIRFLIVGSHCNRLFISAEDFYFCETVTPRIDCRDYTKLDLDDVKDMVNQRVKKYAFNKNMLM